MKLSRQFPELRMPGHARWQRGRHSGQDATHRLQPLTKRRRTCDFDLLLDKLRSRDGVEATVYGVPRLTAQSLIRAATRYVPIEGALLFRKGGHEGPRD